MKLMTYIIALLLPVVGISQENNFYAHCIIANTDSCPAVVDYRPDDTAYHYAFTYYCNLPPYGKFGMERVPVDGRDNENSKVGYPQVLPLILFVKLLYVR